MNDKKELRRQFRRLRDDIAADERVRAGQRLAEVVGGSPLIHSGRVIAAFASFRSEIPTGPLIRRLRASGKRVLLPRVHAHRSSMEFCEFSRLDQLGTDRLGIPTPDGPVYDGEVDWVLLPGLAFGRDGSRLGYGAGFYDRWLATSTPRVICGAGYALQVVDRLPAEEHDVRLTHIATPEHVIACRAD